ncbi:hypothetical protein CYMTET_38678 [Cymbomonas tetramitiformis]|uniref:DnaJ homologue subfamily C member 28 conserved domain-containing protein n=1 Tax=Cymbomonas tetramitiformis TaxID=36881 RepID=A0AAE0F6C9_9CHLO|nr:hypothetical protein CYMTET_38678 [Cymbomonas tetramitiformis]
MFKRPQQSLPLLVSSCGLSVYSLCLRTICSCPPEAVSQTDETESSAKSTASSVDHRKQLPKTVYSSATKAIKAGRYKSRLAQLHDDYVENIQSNSGERDLLLGCAPASGIGNAAESVISAAVREGKLDNLPNSGKPLNSHEDHSAQFFSTDPSLQAINRVLKHNNFRPLSIELRDDLERDMETFESEVMRLTKKASEGKPIILAHLVADPPNYLKTSVEDLNVAIKRLNDAVLQDRVTYGASWPVQARKCLSLESELTRILN